MIIPRAVFDPTPPAARSREDNHATLLFSWWCTCMALTVILFRVFGRLIRTARLFREDIIMAAAILPLLVRMGCVHVILLDGTNNQALDGDLSPGEISHRMTGSKLVLPARIIYAMFIWIAKFTISEFLRRLTDGYWKRTYNNILRAIQVFLLLTFLVVVIVTLTECHPFTHYWQVTPDPGPGCRQNYAQLVTMGVADIVTDVLLIVFPIPAIVFKSTLTVRRKISLVLLFCLSGFLIAITAIRVPAVIQKNGSQQYRSLWASCEILAAAAVSNALVLGSFVRDRGVKKNKYKFGSVGADSLERTPTRWQSVAFAQRRMLGSDGDLLHGTGYRLAAEPKADDSEKVMTKPAAAVTHPPLVGGRTRPSSRGYNFSRPRGLKRDRSISKRRSGATEDHEELYPKRLPAVPFGDEKVPMSPSTVGNDEPMALQTAHYPSTNAAQTEDALAEADLKAATQHEARHD